jgi:formate hydrogenlyase subunit 4
VLALLTGTTNLDAIVAAMRDGPAGLLVPLGLVLLALGMVALGDCRPLADPATGPAYSGRQLALVTFAAQLRLVLWLSLLAAVFLPFGMAQAGAGPLAWTMGAVCWALKLLVLVAVLGMIGATGGRLGQARAQGGARHVLGVALLLALLAAVLLFVGQGLV